MTQHNGSLVVAFYVPYLQGQGLAMFQVRLGGIETEGEILLGRQHLQLIAPGRVRSTLGQVPVNVQLVLLLGGIGFPEGQVAVQLVHQLPGLFVQAGGCKAGDGHPSRQRQKRYPLAQTHIAKIIKELQTANGGFDFLFPARGNHR